MNQVFLKDFIFFLCEIWEQYVLKQYKLLKCSDTQQKFLHFVLINNKKVKCPLQCFHTVLITQPLNAEFHVSHIRAPSWCSGLGCCISYLKVLGSSPITGIIKGDMLFNLTETVEMYLLCLKNESMFQYFHSLQILRKFDHIV